MNLYLAAAVLLLVRMFITPRLASVPSFEGIYETAAHIFVGYLIAMLVYDRDRRRSTATLLAVLSLWELGWFLVQRFGP